MGKEQAGGVAALRGCLVAVVQGTGGNLVGSGRAAAGSPKACQACAATTHPQKYSPCAVGCPPAVGAINPSHCLFFNYLVVLSVVSKSPNCYRQGMCGSMAVPP